MMLSGGEALLDPLRAEVTYMVVERLTAKYARRGGVKIVVQTTGDLFDERIVTDLLERGVFLDLRRRRRREAAADRGRGSLGVGVPRHVDFPFQLLPEI